jgi:hypothetical protein|tara:strand:- start:3268 stop:3723 length:456 start_codon:yes stop_codon:yes gene_type:complete
MHFSEETKTIFVALIKAKAQMKHPTKNQINPFFKSKYADQQQVFDAVYPALNANDLHLFLEPEYEFSENKKNVSTKPMLIHASGEFIHFSTISLPITKCDAHSVAGAWTYLSRYSLSLLFGLSADDDADGNDTYTKAEASQKNKFKEGVPR